MTPHDIGIILIAIVYFACGWAGKTALTMWQTEKRRRISEHFE